MNGQSYAVDSVPPTILEEMAERAGAWPHPVAVILAAGSTAEAAATKATRGRKRDAIFGLKSVCP